MKCGYLQFTPEFGRPDKNLNFVYDTLKNSSEADLIVLPELAFSGYNFNSRAELETLAEDIRDSKIIKSLIRLCALNDFFLVTGFAEKHDGRLYNSAVLIAPDGVRHVYRKIHLFYNEKNIFDPGNIRLQVQQVKNVKIGIMICWDWIFPETTRVLALKGADLICHPSNLVLDFCQRTMIGRSIENSVFTITANRTGTEDRAQGKLIFTGKSQVTGPRGELIRQSGESETALVLVDIDASKARNKNFTPLNHIFQDRRSAFYKNLSD